MALGDILGVLRDAYCRTIGIEYMHIQETDEQRWIQEQVEGVAAAAQPPTSSAASSSGSTPPRRSRSSSPPSTSARSASASRAPSRRSRSSTRSSTTAADAGLDGAVLGMAHRGRLNVLANIVGKSYDADLQGVRGPRRPRHRCRARATSSTTSAPAGKFVSPSRRRRSPVELAANPSHLETVDPVVRGHGAGQAGPASSRPGRIPVLPMLIHGDAAFAGQGVVAETLQPVATSRATASAAPST